MHDIIIVGAGPAGLSAAIYASRAGKTVLMLEAGTYGGQIVATAEVENYPGIKKISGFEFAMNLYEQALDLGAEIAFEKVVSVKDANSDDRIDGDGGLWRKPKKIVVTEKNTYECKAVILATGAKNRPLGIEGEDALIGRGLSYCATCDGAFYRGKDVAIVGGGNTALEDAMFLSEYCSKVFVIHRRNEFRGENFLYENLTKRENVQFVLESVIESILTFDEAEENNSPSMGGRIRGIIVKNVKTEELIEIKVSGVFVAIGQMPNNKEFENIVELDNKGYVAATENCRTKTEGIFTAGDCRTKTVRQLTTATADGAIAAIAAVEFINLNR